MQWLWQILDRCIAAVCALACIQIPSFFVQYMQRLAGHIQELRLQLNTLTELAKQSGLTLPQYIHKFTVQTDRDFSEHGLWMQSLTERYSKLFQSWQAIQEAGPWARPFSFATQMDSSIAKGAWEDFTPALTISTEGFLYAFLGILIGSCAVFLLRNLAKLCMYTARLAFPRRSLDN